MVESSCAALRAFAIVALVDQAPACAVESSSDVNLIL